MKKSSKRKEQTITMCVCVCFSKRQFCAQFAITHSSSHSIAVRRRSLIECLPAGERERERTRTMPAWHARSLYLVMLPHVLALPSIHSLSRCRALSRDRRRRPRRKQQQQQQLQAFSCAGIPLIRLWYVDACAGKQRCQVRFEFFRVHFLTKSLPNRIIQKKKERRKTIKHSY